MAVNEHAALPHYFGNSGVVCEKCIVLMDFGCIYKGMYSDTTRTIFVGKATEREREIYNLVLKANLAGEAAAKNGAWIPDVDGRARKVIEDAGYGVYFNHRLGHGIGYDEHEAPYIRGDYEMHLEPGMAFSCEPGIYIKDDIGIRIEDVVIINEKGETEILNHTSKELTESPDRFITPAKKDVISSFFRKQSGDAAIIRHRDESFQTFFRFTTKSFHSSRPSTGLLPSSGPVGLLVKKSFFILYSHSMVPVGFGVRSNSTRFTPATSWVMRSVIF